MRLTRGVRLLAARARTDRGLTGPDARRRVGSEPHAPPFLDGTSNSERSTK